MIWYGHVSRSSGSSGSSWSKAKLAALDWRGRAELQVIPSWVVEACKAVLTLWLTPGFKALTALKILSGAAGVTTLVLFLLVCHLQSFFAFTKSKITLQDLFSGHRKRKKKREREKDHVSLEWTSLATCQIRSRIQAHHARFPSFRRLPCTISFISVQHFINPLILSGLVKRNSSLSQESAQKPSVKDPFSIRHHLSPEHIHSTTTLPAFKPQLKSFLFQKPFCPVSPLHLTPLQIFSAAVL